MIKGAAHGANFVHIPVETLRFPEAADVPGIWTLQVNSQGLGLCPKEIISRMETAGFTGAQTMEMITGAPPDRGLASCRDHQHYP